LIGVTSAEATANSTIVNQTAVGGGTQISAGLDANVTAQSGAFGDAHADNSVSAGFVAVGQTETATNLDHTNQIQHSGGVAITAGANLTLYTLTANHADGYANGHGSAFLAIGSNSATTNVKYVAGTAIGSNDKPTAGGAL